MSSRQPASSGVTEAREMRSWARERVGDGLIVFIADAPICAEILVIEASESVWTLVASLRGAMYPVLALAAGGEYPFSFKYSPNILKCCRYVALGVSNLTNSMNIGEFIATLLQQDDRPIKTKSPLK